MTNNVHLVYHPTQAQDFGSLVNAYPARELPKPTRSTVPLLSFWKAYPQRLPKFLKELGQVHTGEVKLYFEFQVASFGRNKPSHTDLMILTDQVAIAIEAKWSEGQYDSLSKWFAKDPSDNRKTVISHWLNLISQKIGCVPCREDLNEVIYQMIHRTASACSFPAKKPILVYQSFEEADDPHPDRFGALTLFYNKLHQPENLQFWFARVPVRRTDAFRALAFECANVPANRAEKIRTAIIEHDLFEFGEPELVKIS